MKRLILRLRLLTLAAWLYDVYRLSVKLRTRGALVALWCQGRVLLVQASYQRELSLPGGWINRGEAPEQAAQGSYSRNWGWSCPWRGLCSRGCYANTHRGVRTQCGSMIWS